MKKSSLWFGASSPKTRQQQRQRRVFFEGLEDRSLMATWTGAGAVDNWNDPANWGGNVPDGDVAGESAVFNTTVNVSLDIDLTGAANPIAVQFNAGSTVAIAPVATNALQVSTVTQNAGTNSIAASIKGAAGSVIVNGGTLTLSGANTYGGNSNVTAGTLRFNSAGAIGGVGRSVDVAANATVAAGYAIDNAFLNRLVENSNAFNISMVVASANNLDLSSATGATLPNAVLYGAGNTAYTGTLTPNGNTYRIGNFAATWGNTNTFTMSALTGATNSLVVSGTGLIIINSASNYKGTTTVNPGASLRFDGVIDNIGTIIMGTGVRDITLGAGSSFARTAGLVNNAFLNRLVENSNAFTIYMGNASNGNSLDFNTSAGANLPNASLAFYDSAGTQTFTYTGTLTPNNNVYRLGGPKAGNNINLTVANALTGARDVVVSGGNVRLMNNMNYTGTTTINAGTFTIASPVAGQTAAAGYGQIGGGNYAGNIINNGTLAFNSNLAQTLSGVISGTGVVTKNSTTSTGGGSVTHGTTSTLTLTGVNTYAGATNINAGILNIQNNSALGTTAAGTTVASGASLHVQNNITVTGEALTLVGDGSGGTGALRNVSGNNTWTGNLTVNAGTTTRIIGDTAGALLTLSGNVALSSTATDQFVLQGNGDGLISGIISGPSRVTKSVTGTGTWTLTGVNTYGGATSVGNGTLIARVNNTQNSISTGAATILTGATLLLDNTKTTNAAHTIGNTFSGAGTLQLNFAAGTTARNTTMNDVGGMTGTIRLSNSGATGDKWNLAAATTTTAALIIDSGSQLFANGANTKTFGSITVQGTGNSENRGAIRMSNAAGILAGNITLAGNTTFGTEGGTISGNISTSVAVGTTTLTLGGTGSTGSTLSGVIGNGAGTVAITQAVGTNVLSGANSYSGATAINGGILSILNDTALGTAAAGTTVASGASLYLANNITVTGEALTLVGDGSVGTGALRNVSGNNTWTGNLTVSAGATTRIMVPVAGDLLTLSGNIALSPTATDQFVLQDNGNGLISGVISGVGRVTKSATGTGTWTLSGANTYTGGTTVSNGTLKAGVASVAGISGAFGNNSAVTMTNAAGAILDITGFNTQIGSLTGGGATGGNVTLGAATLTVGGNNTSPAAYAGIISGIGGQLSKIGSGTLTLSGNNTYTGATAINAGVLLLSGGGTISTASTISVNNTGTLRFGRNDTWGNHLTDVTSPIIVNAGGTMESGGFFNTLRDLTLNGGTVALTGGVNATFPAFAWKGIVTVGGTQASNVNAVSGSFNIISIGDDNLGPTVFNVADSTSSANADLVVNVPLQNNQFGPAGLTKSGVGTLNLTAANTFTGPTTINAGVLLLSGGGTISTASTISVNNTGTLRFGRNDTWGNHLTDVTSPIIVNAGGTMESGGFFNTLRDLTLNGGTVALTGGVNATFPAFAWKGTVTVGGTQASNVNAVSGGFNIISIGDDNLGPTVFNVADSTSNANADLVVNVPLQDNQFGPAGLTKSGVGTLNLTAANTFGGQTTVSAGTLLANNTTGSATGTGNVIVNNAAVFGGTGSVSGSVTMNNTSRLAPGTSVESLATGSVTWTGSTFFDVEIDGLAGAGTLGGHDILNVTGSVTLGGATLTLIGTPAGVPNPSVLQTFTIIDNDGTGDAVSGTFAGLPESAPILFNSGLLFISYVGGDGNDVVLSSQLMGTLGADTIVVTPVSASSVTYQLNANPAQTLTGITSFTFNGLNGDDLMTVNLNANALPGGGVFFNGGTEDFTVPLPTPNHGDVIRVVGDGAGTHTAEYRAFGTPGATNKNVNINTNSGLITSTGVEPGDVTGMAVVDVYFDGGDEVLTITNGVDAGTGANQALVVTGTTGGNPFEGAFLWNNTQVNIDTANISLGGTDGNDTITIASADNLHGNVNVTLNAGTGTDTITFNGGLSVTGNVSLTSGGSIGTGGAATDVTAATLTAVATTGITLDTDVIDATLTNSGVGNVTITELSALNLLGLSVATGNATITASGALTDGTNATTSVSGLATLSSTTITLGESGTDSVNFGTLTFTAGGAVDIAEDSSTNLAGTSSGSVVTLTTTADLTIPAAVVVTATAGNITLNLDSDDNAGATLTIDPAAIVNTLVANHTAINGGNLADTFIFDPQNTTEFRVFGDNPTTSPGDVLQMNVTGLNATLLLPGTVFVDANSGDWTFTGRRAVYYGSIEDLNTTGLYGIGINNNAATSQYANLRIQLDTSGPPQLQVFANANPTPIFQDLLTNVLSLQVSGNNNNVAETVTIDDVNGLPTFASTPALAPDNLQVTGTPGIVFYGVGGTNTLAFNLNAANTSQIYGIGNGTTGSPDANGEMRTVTGASILNAYGTELNRTVRTGGSTGLLAVIAEGGGDNIVIDDGADLTSTDIAAAGYAPLNFSGNNYSGVTVFGMGGTDTLDLTNIGSGQSAVLPITLDGDTADDTGAATNGDASVDTLRVRATGLSTGTVTLLGGDGDDIVEVGLGNTDGILGQVVVLGEGGADSLTVDNRLSLNADTATVVDEDSISNETGRNAADDVTYNSVETLPMT